jgi:hypothetical protein
MFLPCRPDVAPVHAPASDGRLKHLSIKISCNRGIMARTRDLAYVVAHVSTRGLYVSSHLRTKRSATWQPLGQFHQVSNAQSIRHCPDRPTDVLRTDGRSADAAREAYQQARLSYHCPQTNLTYLPTYCVTREERGGRVSRFLHLIFSNR